MTGPSDQPPSLGRGWRWWLRRLAVAAVLLGVVGWLLRQPLLRTLARAWVVEQPVEQADAIVIATSTREVLFQEAIGWFRSGRASRIVLLDSETRPTDRAGITQPGRITRLRDLHAAGVPEGAVILVGHELTTLHEGFTALRGWAQSNQVHRLLMPVEPFATRRVARLSRRMLEPMGVRAMAVPVAVPNYSVDEWWRKEDGMIAFENEGVMAIYYWLRY